VLRVKLLILSPEAFWLSEVEIEKRDSSLLHVCKSRSFSFVYYSRRRGLEKEKYRQVRLVFDMWF
jgi:hypothetical protein